MKPASPFSGALAKSFAAHVAPLLEPLGFAPSRCRNVRPGVVVTQMSRQTAAGRVEATLWCDAATGNGLTFRFDLVTTRDGVELSDNLVELFRWERGGLSSGASAMRPHEGPERLELAVELVAGILGANATELARRVPELASGLSVEETRWKLATTRAHAIWEARNRRGEFEERPVAATVRFLGVKLLSVDAEGRRYTFSFDTAGFDRDAPITLSRWCETPAKTLQPTSLTSGGRTRIFNERGELIEG